MRVPRGWATGVILPTAIGFPIPPNVKFPGESMFYLNVTDFFGTEAWTGFIFELFSAVPRPLKAGRAVIEITYFKCGLSLYQSRAGLVT